MTDADKERTIRAMLAHDISVYYVKSESINREREERKARTIDWLTERFMAGPLPYGSRTELPDCSFIFGTSIFKAERDVIFAVCPVCALCPNPTQEVHHILPRFLGGTDDPCNLIGLCRDCHDDVHRVLDMKIRYAVKDSLCLVKGAMANVKGMADDSDKDSEVKE